MLDETGTRIYPIVRIKQYRYEGRQCPGMHVCRASSGTDHTLSNNHACMIVVGTSLIRKDIAFVEQQKNGSISFRFLEGIDDNVIYPGKL